MERIEIPVEIHFKAVDGKKFSSEAECTKYEYLLAKYMTSNRHKTCEDGEGHVHHFFYVNDLTEELKQVMDWCWYLLGYRPYLKDGIFNRGQAWDHGWLWLPWEEQYCEGPTPELGTINDFIELQKECIAGYKHSLTMAEQIKNTPGPRFNNGSK